MQIFTHTPVSYDCDGCKKAFQIDVPLGSKYRAICRRISEHHREQSPRCPRDMALLTTQRSYADEFNVHKATPHFRMGWRDADELDLTPQEKKTPMIIIG